MRRMILCLLFTSVLTRCADGDDYRQAIREGADACYVYHVVDDDGQPVIGASVRASFRSYGRQHDNCDLALITDTNGMVKVAHRVNERLNVGVDKRGYYHAHDSISFLDGSIQISKDGKWQPYGGRRRLILKKIRALGSLTVLPGRRRMGEWRIPCQNTWIGFDLEMFDWIHPYGSGVNPDVLLRISSRVLNRFNDFTYAMDVTFTNNPCAGAYVKTKDRSSDLYWDASANVNGVFLTDFSFVREKSVGKNSRHDFLSKDQYIIYRTRTRIDEHGRLSSAHYGMISGPWISGDGAMYVQDMVFNQNENDPVIEDGLFLREIVDYRIKQAQKEVKDGNTQRLDQLP